MRGVTTIRDTGGDTAGFQKAIDQGYLTGPRIYPSQAVLSQYSGHIDFRNPNVLPREWVGPVAISDVEKFGITKLVNGDQQMLAAVRDNLYKGATQIKLAISGGVMSYTDPLYVNEFLPEEIEAAVRASEDFGTYVTVHVHNASAIKRAIKAGVKSFDHLSLADEEAIKMMAEAGAHGSVQILVAKDIAEQYPKGDVRQEKAQEALDNIDKVMGWAKKYKLHMGWGTDLCDTIENRLRQLETLKLKKQWFSDAEIMIQATGNGGETVALCGKRNPYGRLGVIEENAMADILIYKKNPLEDVSVVEDYENNLVFVMKDGKIYKNTLGQ
jgi:imidazolonepropionase-like amidohydrolase